jgi:hypothetical protein
VGSGRLWEGVVVADLAYHTNSQEYPPEHRNVHHNNNNCKNGKQIKQQHRMGGTGGKPLCKDC